MKFCDLLEVHNGNQKNEIVHFVTKHYLRLYYMKIKITFTEIHICLVLFILPGLVRAYYDEFEKF